MMLMVEKRTVWLIDVCVCVFVLFYASMKLKNNIKVAYVVRTRGFRNTILRVHVKTAAVRKVYILDTLYKKKT